jgi:hypothetical protein
MSYDLSVYGERLLPSAEVVELVREIPGLDVAEEMGGSLTVLRGKRAAYCFTVDGPFGVEIEDVPDEVTAVTIGSEAMYQVLIEGSSEASIPYAIRFGKRLAEKTNGAMFDQQTDVVWSKNNRTVARPKANDRIDVIRISWYFPDDSRDLAALYLAAARKYLPEALPRRFGEFEPLQNKLDLVGEAGFRDAATAATGLLFWKGAFPVVDGHLSLRNFDGSPRPLPTFQLSLERSAFQEPKWRDALRSLFLDFGRAGGAYFASAEVVRNLSWSGRSVWYDGKQENVDGLLRYREGWMGLPPYPVWLTLFGPDYAKLVRPHLAADSVDDTGATIFRTWSDSPQDRDALSATLPKTGLFRKVASSWLPKELTATQLPFTPGHYPRPLAKAELIPEFLRREI